VGVGNTSFIAALTVAGISGVGPGDAVAQAANRRKAAMDAMKKRIKLLTGTSMQCHSLVFVPDDGAF
jgi:hypothetical protein